MTEVALAKDDHVVETCESSVLRERSAALNSRTSPTRVRYPFGLGGVMPDLRDLAQGGL